MKKNDIKKLTLSAMFLALALVMPFLTGQIPQIGAMLCPMHIPVLLCGFFCGGPWGLLVGFVAPVLRSIIFGMPPMFPKAICMAFELATYGLVSGLLHKVLPKKKWTVYVSLILAMIAGRVVWGLAMLICMGFDVTKFGASAFISGALLNAIPGIIVQLVLIPILVIVLEKYVKREE
ncbi:MAG: ECF transporter S component [Lachnospiraceae bacterium]|nr:ECF transporter S component [Lachnospiraceae bacterium]